MNDRKSIVFTNPSKCRDCYRCLRACPVKAIKMENQQAFVEGELCISCGTCVSKCPQKSKQYQSSIEQVRALFNKYSSVSLSIAPSWPAFFEPWQWKFIPSALRILGFDHVSETSNGAYFVSLLTSQIQGEGIVISSSCPAVVSMIEKYYPQYVSNIAGVVSPMVAHSRIIKKERDTKVVFAGPCIAKKEEMQKYSAGNSEIDAVITFEELIMMFEESGIDISGCEASEFDVQAPVSSLLYPILEGCLEGTPLKNKAQLNEVLSVSGEWELRQLLDSIDTFDKNLFIDALFCKQGCINGPASGCDSGVFVKKNRLLKYVEEKRNINTDQFIKEYDLEMFKTKYSEYHDRGMLKNIDQKYSEEEIQKVLNKTGKYRIEDQLDCGACGYGSCREKAIAVLNKMAEIEMCMPFMRRSADKRTDRIMETSPNGIIILNENFIVTGVNNSFCKLFRCSSIVEGRHVSEIFDPEGFDNLRLNKRKVDRVIEYFSGELICQETLYYLEEEKQYIGIFVNITQNQKDRETLNNLKNETVLQAKEMMEHQIEMAQNIASFLGESTAKGEQLVDNLLKLVNKTGGK